MGSENLVSEWLWKECVHCQIYIIHANSHRIAHLALRWAFVGDMIATVPAHTEVCSSHNLLIEELSESGKGRKKNAAI